MNTYNHKFFQEKYTVSFMNFQLEEGEVDVRLNSFKGCFIQRYNKSRP